MAKITDRYRSKLGNAKGLGAAGHGLAHWWLQRTTAVALIPLSVWFVITLLQMVMFPTPELVAEWLASPLNAMVLVLLVIALFAHAYLGLQVIIEDYVKCPYSKYGLIILSKFLSIIFAAACLLSIMRLHFIDLGINL